MKVTFRTMDHKTVIVDASLDSNVHELMQLLEKEHGFDSSNISLIFSGKILEDSITLTSLDYQESNWLVLFPKKLKPTATATATETATASVTTASKRSDAEKRRQARIDAGIEVDEKYVPAGANNEKIKVEIFTTPYYTTESTPTTVSTSTASTSTASTSTTTSTTTASTSTASISTSTSTSTASTSTTTTATDTTSAPVISTTDGKVSVKLPSKDIKALQQIKGSLLKLITDLSSVLNDYQINTIVYEAYQAAEKEPDLALNMLLFRILGPMTAEQLLLLKEVSKYDE
jgi:hypothetical protein